MPALGWGFDPYGAVTGWSGSGASVSGVTAGVATITGLQNMSPLSVGRYLTLFGTSNARNAGIFPIVEYVSASSVKVTNANAITPDGNNGSIGWIERLQSNASVFGAAAAGIGTSIVSALATSTNEVLVTLSSEPVHSSPFGAGDALNTATWAVQRIDTAITLTVVGVVAASPTSYKLTVLEGFGPVSALHRVSSSTLLDASHNLLKPPRSADFYGTLNEDDATDLSRAAKRRAVVSDIANYPSAQAGSAELGQGGTLLLDGAGDYSLVTGEDLVRKLVMRRLTSRKGDFFHLPNYGIGFREKEPLTVPDLAKLKKEVERQVLLESEVQAVKATLTLQPGGILTAQIRAKLRPAGQEIQVTTPVRDGLVTL